MRKKYTVIAIVHQKLHRRRSQFNVHLNINMDTTTVTLMKVWVQHAQVRESVLRYVSFTPTNPKRINTKLHQTYREAQTMFK